MAVDNLKVDPGAKVREIAWLISGFPAVVGYQLLVVVQRDEARQAIVLVGGQRDHRQDFAGLWVEDDDHAHRRANFAGGAVEEVHPVLQGGSGHSLQPRVDGELEAVAGRGLGQVAHFSQGLAGHVFFNVLEAVAPGQDVLEGRLDAGVADLVPIDDEVELLVLLLQGGRDRAEVADDVRGQCPGDVVPHGLGLDADAGHVHLLLAEGAGDGLVDVAGDGPGFVRRDRGTLVDELLDASAGDTARRLGPFTVNRHPAQCRKAFEDRVDLGLAVGQQGGGNHDVERRNVANEDRPVSIVDHAPRSGNVYVHDPVLGRVAEVGRTLQNLQAKQLGDEDQEHHRHDDICQP